MRKNTGGFTLIEMSIVLVVIGLIVGGVLVGQDLIRAAEVRATITQIEKFNTATNTFYGKFQALPGDMNYSTAAAYGFNTGSGYTTSAITGCGRGGWNTGNGDGILAGLSGDNWLIATDEQGCFWVDISSQVAGNLIEGSYSSALARGTGIGCPMPSYTALPLYLPVAKLGGGNFVYVFSTGGFNYYGVSAVTNTPCSVVGTGTISPRQAYNIDKKIDDGYPNSGNVIAYYLSGFAVTPSTPNNTAAAAGNCYDATGVTGFLQGSPGVYNTSINGGAGTGCGLMFKFQ